LLLIERYYETVVFTSPLSAGPKRGLHTLPSVLDLFSGCGGLSLGAHKAGMKTALAVDIDPILSSAFRLNFPKADLLNLDVRKLDASVARQLLPSGVDGIVGGPPCQAFSEMGRRDASDPRRDLIWEFFRIVRLVRPKFFLFENVPGLASKRNVHLLQDGLSTLPSSWIIFGPHLINAAEFGAPTKRQRIFVFGFNRDEMVIPSESELVAPTNLRVTVSDAISDLAGARLIGQEGEFDCWKYGARRSISSYAKGMRTKNDRFTGHQVTAHTAATLKRFAALKPKQVDKIGKYVRLSLDGLCPTLRAGTGSDRGSYQAVRPVHPTEDRVITPREAARLQGFPDSFRFHPTVWHSCRMIGNSVSPIIAKVLLSRIGRSLEASDLIKVAAE